MKPVVVVGTVFVDVKGFPQALLDFAGRNLGRVEIHHGGVGRNVAETLALLGAPVRFVSSVAAGGLGDEVLQRLRRAGVDVNAVPPVAAAGMGMWLAIMQHHGDVACSISQMPGLDGMKSAWGQHQRRLLADAGLCVLELDLDEEMADRVLTDAGNAGVPVVGLPGNFSVIRSRPDLLRRLAALVLNQHEAGLLLGSAVPTPEAAASARRLLAWGPQCVVITLGDDGAVAVRVDRPGEPGEPEVLTAPARPVTVVDTTGAGDAFVSGFSLARGAGADLATALGCATRVAGWTVASAESVCPDLRPRIAADPWPGWREL